MAMDVDRDLFSHEGLNMTNVLVGDYETELIVYSQTVFFIHLFQQDIVYRTLCYV